MTASVRAGDGCHHSFEFYILLHFFHLFYATNSLNGVQLLVITNDPFSSLRCTTVLSLCALTSPTRHPCQSEDTWGATCQNTASASDPENRGHGSFTCSTLCADTRPDREIYRLWRGGSAAAALVDHCTVSVDVPHVSRLSAAILFHQEQKSRSRRIMTVAA